MDDQQKDPKVTSPQSPANTSLPPAPSVPSVPVEVEPSTAPVPPSQFDETIIPPVGMPAQKPNKRKKIMILILILVLVLIGGGVAAYKLWYQNPEKVISDGIVHALQAKTTVYTGSFNVDTETAKVKVILDGGYKSGTQNVNADVTVSMGNIDYNVKANVLVDDKSDFYIKIANLDAVAAPLRASMPESVQEPLDDLVAKLNDKWVKITAEELATFSQEASKSQTCISNVVQQTENNSSLQKEVEELYKKNKFVVVSEELGEKDGSLGYVLSVDKAKAKTFVADLKNTEVYKTLYDCDKSFEIRDDFFETSSDTTTTARTEVWVSTFMHHITKTSLTTTDKESSLTSKIELNPTFNTDVTIKTPEQSMTLKQLQADFENMQQEAMKAELQSASDTSI